MPDKPVNMLGFFIPRHPPSLNTLLRMHWRKRHELQEVFDYMIRCAWGRERQRIFLNPVRITLIVSSPKKRTRDIDNYIGGSKLIIDALKKTFIFRDDSEWVTEIKVKFTKGPEGTAILIEEV